MAKVLKDELSNELPLYYDFGITRIAC